MIKTKKRKLRIKPHPRSGYMPHKYWTRAFPFNANPRGILVHRVRSGLSFFVDGKHSHDAVDYWCGNMTNGEGVSMVAVPPKDRLVCSVCEALAVAAGEPSSDKLVGRHVHIGRLKAVRECCRECDSN